MRSLLRRLVVALDALILRHALVEPLLLLAHDPFQLKHDLRFIGQVRHGFGGGSTWERVGCGALEPVRKEK